MLTVSITESVVLAARPPVRLHVTVPTLQVHPPVESVIAVTVISCGSANVNIAELSIAVDELVFVTFTVTWSAVSPCFTIIGLGLSDIVSVGTTTGCTNVDKSKSAYSSISSCALIFVSVGHSAGYILLVPTGVIT